MRELPIAIIVGRGDGEDDFFVLLCVVIDFSPSKSKLTFSRHQLQASRSSRDMYKKLCLPSPRGGLIDFLLDKPEISSGPRNKHPEFRSGSGRLFIRRCVEIDLLAQSPERSAKTSPRICNRSNFRG